MNLSVLDLVPVDGNDHDRNALNHTIELAKSVDKLGYRRYWIAEHHNLPTVASAATETIMNRILSVTSNLRVGSGGIMIPNHSPLRIAESFKTMEAFYPNRVDLGIGRAPGTDGLTAFALRRSNQPYKANDLDAQLIELFNYDSYHSEVINNELSQIRAIPQSVPLPPVYVLGSSVESARLASQKGLSYVYAYQFNQNDVKKAVKAYRQETQDQQHQNMIVSVSVIGGQTEEEVHYLKKAAMLKYLNSAGMIQNVDWNHIDEIKLSKQQQLMAESYLQSQLIGTFEELKQKLTHLANELAIDELMITTTQFGEASRENLYKALASLITK
ncbi:MsnO8 family LLM class oxidoreductase [Staphylococcus argensis]|uniref:LLM class flavin-dependent oxidoreductase n=1 Tax=Staphylococcus argensis TaxID=1607738 RepID=A0A2K4FAY6_9STAP|nr:MsnO8 family LLM class oxidoreductase [Staphylococcus argensis]MCY6991707.1 MsnO8 family LLM class oxidoreductase [Staphylococcus argensis]POA08510.1 LLM class flavin-dependent oxidoreductase [Staphylococcus argensis]